MNIETIVADQNEFYRSGATRPLAFRRKQLQRLKDAIHRSEAKIFEALHRDLAKSSYEAYLSEVGFVLDEIRFTLPRLSRWMKSRRVRTPLLGFPGASRRIPEPYGQVLIIAPWNYPFQLAISPLIGAVAAGNCCVVKPSELSPRTSAVLAGIVRDTFPPEYVTVVEGGPEASIALLETRFDKIFFTGSTRIGRKVMTAAARHLTPVTLELGGKSPCIVAEDADLPLASRRIVSGKFMNTGQTCIAPDFLLVHKAIKEPLLAKILSDIKSFFGDTPRLSPDYGRIISRQHFDRLAGLMDGCRGTIITGGDRDRETRYMAPTVLDNVEWDDPIMEEEIFGPLLPVMRFDRIASIQKEISQRPKPLALYLFTKNRKTEHQLVTNLSFGGGCINDTLLHIATPYLPFGGVGDSGTGQYHGKASFDTFSHTKSVMKRYFLPEPPVRYPPYGKRFSRLLRWLLR
ncbi:Aldehyde dehydrogenase (EC [Olavius algarvensis associated proteobacterium Delta 3]|nr:Aldehyde dehydrogenase (EC [Olavius algarvensis associated proteobacterium Delta 3]